jgi:hypothetical protein
MKKVIAIVAVLFGMNGYAQTIESPLKLSKNSVIDTGVWYKDKNKGKVFFGDINECEKSIDSVLILFSTGVRPADYVDEFNGHEMKMWYLNDGYKLFLTSDDKESMLVISNISKR